MKHAKIKYALVAFAFIFLGQTPVTFAASCSSYIDTVTAGDSFNDASFAKKLAVKFTLSSECDVSSLGYEVGSEGTNPTAPYAQIYTDSGGTVPGTPIASSAVFSTPVDYPATSLQYGSASACLEPGTYWFVAGSPSNPGDGYFWGGTGSVISETHARLSSGGWVAYSVGVDFVYDIQDGGTSCGGGGGGGTSIDAAIAVATSSFQNTYGFDMDGMAAWMWDNLGQPIAGSGLGTLMVLKWQILGLISISIIVFFAFAYFRFFKH